MTCRWKRTTTTCGVAGAEGVGSVGVRFEFRAALGQGDWVVIDHHPTDLKPQHALLLHDVKNQRRAVL